MTPFYKKKRYIIPAGIVVLLAVLLLLSQILPAQEENITWDHVETQASPATIAELKVAVAESALAGHDSKEDVLSVEDVTVVGDWALLGYTYRNAETGEYVGTSGLIALLHRTSSDWELTLQGSPTFCEWLPSVPPQLFGGAIEYYEVQICS